MIEGLEDRRVMAFASVLNSPNNATITGDNASDTLQITVSSGLLVHNRGGDAGFNSNSDWDSAVAGDQTVTANALSKITILTGAGDDLVNLGSPTSAASDLLATFNYIAGGTGDTLTVDDSARLAVNSYTSNNASVNGTGIKVSITALISGGRKLITGQGADTVAILATFTDEPQSFDSAGGVDDVTISGSGIDASVTIANGPSQSKVTIDRSSQGAGQNVTVTNTSVTGLTDAPINLTAGDIQSLSIKTGTNVDVVTVSSTDAGIPTSIDTGNGDDAISIASGVSLNGGTLNGGAGNNSLTADGPFVITGTDQGTSNGNAFQNIGSLIGSSGNDSFRFQAAGALSRGIDGAGGTNAIFNDSGAPLVKVSTGVNQGNLFRSTDTPPTSTILNTSGLAANGYVNIQNVYAAPSLVVTTAIDEDNGTSDASFGTGTSLREAIAYANSKSGADAITFTAALAGQTITLTAGQLTLTDTTGATTITGPAGGVTISGGWSGGAATNGSRVFVVSSSVTATLTGLTITAGNAGSGKGGAILAAGPLTINDSVISNSQADQGGGIYINQASSVTINRSTISGNSATGFSGGGIWTNTPLTLLQSTLVGNTGGSFQGGGLSVGAFTTNIIQSTITGNSAPRGGGVATESGGNFNLQNSLIVGNTASLSPEIGGNLPNGGGSFTDNGGNIIGLNSGETLGQVVAVDSNGKPLLANNGGPTPTVALIAGSRAIDAGNNANAVDANNQALTGDQRDYGPRINSGTVDVGAVEFGTTARETSSLVVTTSNDVANSFDGIISLREAIAFANSNPDASIITFGDGSAISGGTNFLDGTADTITVSINGDGTAGPSAFGITSDITIQGSTANSITIQGGGSSSNLRAFYIASAGTLSLQNLTINGFRHEGGGSNRGGGAAGMGGAIFVNGGTLNLLATTIANNAVQGGGFGSFSDGGGGLGRDAFGQFAGGGPNSFGSDVNNGASGGFGGGGNAYGGNGGFGGGGGFSGTGGFGGGGGAFTPGGFGGGNGGALGAGGGAGMGGAIFSNGGTINITNSTFQGNAAFAGSLLGGRGQGLGGVLFARNGSVTINNSTLSGNTAADGGRGVYVLSDASNGGNNTSPGSGTATVVINNTIIGQADNSVSDFVANTNAGGATPVTSGVGNLIRTAVGFNGTIVSAADPQLAALANNGGPTPTMLLLVGSPALDAGNDIAIPNGLMTDQRGTGFARIYNGTVDIGAFEFAPSAPTVTAPTATNIALTTATLGGNVTADGRATITERGIVYSVTSLNNNPQLGGASVTQVTTAGTTGVFTIDVTALPTGTQISYAAYATNIAGTSYTTVGTFTTQPAIGQFGGITVQILNNVMIVTGTEQDDTIKVASDGMGGYIVTANKPINGLPSPQTFTGATSFVANTLGGNDDLWLAAPLTLNSVSIDLGNGNDRAVLGADPNNSINNNVLDPQFGTLGYLTVNGPMTIIGGEGNDRVLERSTNVNGVKTINLGEGNNEYNVYWGFSNETIFSSGAGADNVYIGYLTSRQASQFDTGAGNDLISYYASRFNKTAYLNSGAGADTVALDVNIYDDAATVDTGSEADYLLFSRSVAYKSVVLTTAAGADTVLIGKYISGLNGNGSPIYSNGGSNIDQLTLNTGVDVDTVQIAANVMRLFFANLGDAYDEADVEANIFTDGFLDGGGQDMRLRNRGNANLRTRNPG